MTFPLSCSLRSFHSRGVLFLAGLASALTLAAAEPKAYDLVIRGARVLDGTGTPWYAADVAVADGRIAAVGQIPGDAATKRTIDATGLYLAPGFIDPHSHAWANLGKAALAGAEPLLADGVTTVCLNPDGFGPTDLALQRRLLEQAHPGINAAQYIGHNSVRIQVMGYANRTPNDAELAHMAALVRRGMEAGAIGLSAGPFYTPGNFSKVEEHIALAKVAAEYNGVYASHIRDESDYTIGVVAAVDEAIAVGREAHLPAIVTHIKVIGPNLWGRSAEVIRHIQLARDAGVQVFADQYPYDASSTSLSAALAPAWALEGGIAGLQRRLANPATRDRIRTEMIGNLARRGGPHAIEISSNVGGDPLIGRRLDGIATAFRQAPVDAAIAILRQGDADIISYNMGEGDIRAFMQQPWTMTCSDGRLSAPGEGLPHPRGYGTFARKLRRYVVELPTITLEQAVHSMTGMPATILRLKDRGCVRAGAWADLVVFDLAAVRDRATYEQPTELSEGMRYVVVNGQVALDQGHLTAARAGRVLFRGDGS